MCGRFSLKTPAALAAQKFDASLLGTWDPSESFVPGRPIPILRMEGDRRVAKTAFWGLVPSWAKDKTISRHTFNARSETVSEKPAFRQAFAKRRCLIPADCFFEWHRRTSTTHRPAGPPWRFFIQNGALFGMAGLWETWVDPTRGDALETCTILTTYANAVVEPHHDRMPVILTEDVFTGWLEPASEPDRLLQLLGPLDPSRMGCEPPSMSEGPLELDLG